MASRARGALSSLLALLVIGCSTTVTESLDPEVNYALKFSEMPRPRATVVHSRVEREQPVFLWLFPSEVRNGEWEFELIATRAWVRVLGADFTPIDWEDVKLRSDLPEWFTPDARRFSALRWSGTSDLAAAHLFIEREPKDPERVHVFLCRH